MSRSGEHPVVPFALALLYTTITVILVTFAWPFDTIDQWAALIFFVLLTAREFNLLGGCLFADPTPERSPASGTRPDKARRNAP